MKLFVEERGTGVPVVVLHGTPMTAAHLRPLAERLARKRRTLLVHLPGYGESPRLDPYDLERSHALVEEALVARGVREAHLVGHCAGAYRAFALARRGNVRALSLVGICAYANLTQEEGAGLLEYARLVRAGAPVVSLIEQAILLPHTKDDPSIAADVRAWGEACAPEHLANEIVALVNAPDLRQDLAKLDAPLLLRAAALDMATPSARSERIASVATRATLQIVEGRGHTILSEEPEASFAAIERHLDAAEPR